MLIKSATALLAGVVALALTVPAQAATATLKVTTCLARNHVYSQAFLRTFVNPINARNGPVKLNYLGGPEVTPFKEQGSALKRGILDMIMCPPAYYSGLFGEARLPGAETKSIAEIHKNGAWDMMEAAWNKHLNAHILSWVFSRGQIFYNYFTEKPKESTKTGLNLSGMKIRSTGLYNAFLRKMGATTVVIAPGDVYAALQRGLVVGLGSPWGSINKYGWQAFLKYQVKPHYFGASQLVVVNLNKWKGLNKAEKNELDQQAHVLETKGADYVVQHAKEDDTILAKAGVKDIVLKGKMREAYLRTIYDAKWAQNDKVNHEADYPKLRALLYKPLK